ncbi:hypothetical protein ROLI_013610 [Roseobacter fucihabitans]|uniref:Uncharacterized protein n=1 Tax=Roseobacter fucihabitans TaxID=1537242 RepID=A0ABZ2BSI6_9RHOB|nr:hypothetical protein [Roseobacter litoralis]MBC6967016.1 hypothetical protein [Roseobacter litoralis]
MRAWDVEFGDLEAKGDTVTEDEKAYFTANRDIAKKTLSGNAAYAGGTPRSALCAVVNLPAVRAVLFLLPSAPSKGHGEYQNRYTYAATVGKALPTNGVREKIDAALADIVVENGLTKTNGHYAAMDLNGTGVRYFGDVCLVLKDCTVAADTLILERNGFEVRVPPVAAGDDTLEAELTKWAGKWAKHAVSMAAMRVIDGRPLGRRLMTTGTVSDRLIEDEDYLEVIMHAGFEPKDVAEVRVTAEDAGAEALIGDRARVGLAPTGAEALWRYRRRLATRLARGSGRNMLVRVVTTTGRAR